MSAADASGGLGPALAERVRPRVRLAHRTPGVRGLGVIARRASGFGRTIGRAGSARARIERVASDGSGSTLRPPVIHWRNEDDPSTDEETRSPVQAARTVPRATAAGTTPNRASGSPTPGPRAIGQSADGPAAARDDAVSLGDPKVDALRRLLRTGGAAAPTTGTSSRRSASRTPRSDTPTSAPSASTTERTTTERTTTASPARTPGERTDRPAAPAASRSPEGTSAPIADPNRPDALRRVPIAPTDPAPPRDARRSPAAGSGSAAITGSPSTARTSPTRIDRSPGGTAAGPRTGPGQLGRRLRPEIAAPAPEVTAAPIPSAAIPTPSTGRRASAAATTPAGVTRPDLPGLPPAQPSRTAPRSTNDRIAALRRTVERHHADGAAAPDGGGGGPAPRRIPDDDRPDPNRPRPATTEPVTPERRPGRADTPAAPTIPGPGAFDSGPSRTRTDRDRTAEATIRPAATLRRENETASAAPVHGALAVAERPRDVGERSIRPMIRRHAEQTPGALRRGLPHSRSLAHRPLTSVTAGLLGHSSIEPEPGVLSDRAAAPVVPPGTVDGTIRRWNTIGAATRADTARATTATPAPTVRRSIEPSGTAPATRRPSTETNTTSATAPRPPAATVPGAGAEQPGRPGRPGRPGTAPPRDPVLLARPGTLFAATPDPVRRSVVAPGPGVLSIAARTAPTPLPEHARDLTSTPRPTRRGADAPVRRTPEMRVVAGLRDTASVPDTIPGPDSAGATTITARPDIARIPVSDPEQAVRERTDALATRFLGELSRGAAPRPTPLPAAFSPLAEAITGRRNVMISTDTTSRRALRAVGRPAATTDDVIHLDRPLVRPDRRSTELLAHELTHVAHPSPAPRFFDDDHRGPEERRAEQVARIMASSPLAPGSPAVRRSPDPRPAGRTPSHQPSPGSITAEELAAQLTGGSSEASSSTRSGGAGTIRRSPRGAPGATLRTTDAAITTTGDHAIRRLTEPSSSTSSSSTTTSTSSASDTPDTDIVGAIEAFLDSQEGREWFRRRLVDDAEVLFRALEDHIIIELERRGGRSWGTL